MTLGRRPRISPPIVEGIVGAVKLGASKKAAAALYGISESTLHEWCRRGRQQRAAKLYCTLAIEIDKAAAQAQVAAIGTIRKAMTEGDWRAAAWFLERSAPTQWGNLATVKVETPEPAVPDPRIKPAVQAAYGHWLTQLIAYNKAAKTAAEGAPADADA